MSEAEEIAKAIQESAKLGEKGLEVADKAGSFLAKVFKEPADEISGMITDKLRFIRWKRMVQMSDEVNKILDSRKVTKTKAVSPKIALSIIEEASLEDDPSLQYLWNNLLANAMNPEFNSEIRYGFIDMIKGITAREAQLLNEFYGILDSNKMTRPLNNLHSYVLYKEKLMDLLYMTHDDYAIAANNLMRLQLIAPGIIEGGVSIGIGQGIKRKVEKLTAYKGIDAITMTPLGVLFVEACIK